MDKKLLEKYNWLTIPHEERAPQERRYKWMKKEALPSDLLKLMYPNYGG